ncbi:hypothetical protein A7C99_5016 [Trichophyton rubrum]|uniref:Uncharacterized protein n=2 Tax=Trichophyton TaxID=5550 RepID=A0A178ERK6_TRIRU|nr:hypothetical protein A7C99_5016 [Trichophyton rubrum]OAL75672.1 hypothetical protein A7D00_1272 [Trichophyton violaceum]
MKTSLILAMAFVSVTIALPKGQTPSTVVSQVIKIDNNHVLDFKLIRISFYGLASQRRRRGGSWALCKLGRVSTWRNWRALGTLKLGS